MVVATNNWQNVNECEKKLIVGAGGFEGGNKSPQRTIACIICVCEVEPHKSKPDSWRTQLLRTLYNINECYMCECELCVRNSAIHHFASEAIIQLIWHLALTNTRRVHARMCETQNETLRNSIPKKTTHSKMSQQRAADMYMRWCEKIYYIKRGIDRVRRYGCVDLYLWIKCQDERAGAAAIWIFTMMVLWSIIMTPGSRETLALSRPCGSHRRLTLSHKKCWTPAASKQSPEAFFGIIPSARAPHSKHARILTQMYNYAPSFVYVNYWKYAINAY